MRLPLICAAAVLASSCVKRVGPSALEDHTVLSGVPVTLGGELEVPEGTQITWEFGDGATGTGSPVQHAFSRAGAFTFTQKIIDKDGQIRTASAHVTVLRRAVPQAVPADARAALILQNPWSKLQTHREVAGRLAMGGFYDDVARSVSDALGFDALDPNAEQAHGFDPDEGVAFYTVPQDPEALLFTVGTLDDAKSLEAVRHMLQHEHGAGRLAGGPFKLSDSKLPDGTPVLLGEGTGGEKVAVLQRFGYLYLRLAGATDPLPGLQSAAALPPDKGLAIDPKYLAALKHVGAGDAVFYSRPLDKNDAARRPLDLRDLRAADEFGAAAFAVSDRPELLQVRLFSQPRGMGQGELEAALKPSKPPPDLAAKLPPGAAAYLRLSASPQALWTMLNKQAPSASGHVQDALALEVEKDLLPSLTGNVGVGVYLDAGSLIEAMMGEQVGNFDKSEFVAAAEITSADAVRAALDKAVRSHPADKREVNGATWYRLSDAAQAALSQGTLFLSVGGPPVKAPEVPAAPRKGKKSPPPPAPDLGVLGALLTQPAGGDNLGAQLKKAGLRGFDVSGLQAAWVDIASIVHGLEKAASDQGGMAGAAARLFADRASGLRDALLQAHAVPDGLEAELFIRFPQGK